MIDIFNIKKPDIYIADINVKYYILLPNGKVPSKDINKNPYEFSDTLIPMLLINNEFPTKKYQDRFLSKLFIKNNIKENFDKIKIVKIKISNAKFSSKIQRDFDFTKD